MSLGTRHSRDHGCPAAGRGGWRVTVDTAIPVWTQPSQLTPAAGGATTAGGATLVADGATPAGGATPDAAGSSQAAMATPSPDHRGPRVVRAPDPWMYDRDKTWADARAVRGKRSWRI
jgi:hypothetical protein